MTKNPLDVSKPLYQPYEVAEIYGISKKTLESWRLRGCGPKFIRLDGSRLVRYRREDVFEHIGDQIPVSSTTEADHVRSSI